MGKTRLAKLIKAETKTKATVKCNFHVLEDKWSLFFKFLDFNKDGTVNENDVDQMTTSLFKLYGRGGCDDRGLGQSLRSWWNVFKTQVGSARDISVEEEFVAAMKELYVHHRAAFVAQTLEMGSAMFDLLDINGDGVIARSEYVKMFSAMGVECSSYVGRVFDSLDKDKSGVLERNEFLQAIKGFFVNDQENKSMAFMFNFPRKW